MDPENESSLAISGPTTVTARFREATDAAKVCKEMVLKKAIKIGKRNYVPVECWMAIAITHGCVATIKSVEETPNGIKAVAEIRRPGLPEPLTTAEGFVGKDETTWYGGTEDYYDPATQTQKTKILPKREEFAIRAMAQTRAVSRACRTAFAHVVVLMDAGLETTPLEEVSHHDVEEVKREEGAVDNIKTAGNALEELRNERAAGQVTEKKEKPAEKTAPTASTEGQPPPWAELRAQFKDGVWAKVKIHFGAKKDTALGELLAKNLKWWCDTWVPKPHGNNPLSQDDLCLRAALDVAAVEAFK